MQIQVHYGRRQLRTVAKCDVIQPNIAKRGSDRDRSWTVLDGRLLVKDLKDIRSRNEALLEDEMNPAQLFHRVVQEKNATEQRNQLSDAQVRIPDIKERKTNPDRTHRFDRRTHQLDRLADPDSVPKIFFAHFAKISRLSRLSSEGFDDSNPGKTLLQNSHHRADPLLF
jgi:hypothetical protein